RDGVATNVEMLLDHGHPGTQDVVAAPALERAPCCATDRSEQIAPGGIPVAMRAKILAQAIAERRVAGEIVELLEDTRRLVVDDRAVVALGLIEVGEPLPDGCRSSRRVHGVRGRLVPEIEG